MSSLFAWTSSSYSSSGIRTILYFRLRAMLTDVNPCSALKVCRLLPGAAKAPTRLGLPVRVVPERLGDEIPFLVHHGRDDVRAGPVDVLTSRHGVGPSPRRSRGP